MEKIRGFEAVTEEMRKGTMDYVLPVRGSSKSAGYDISSPITVTIEPHSSVLVWTNIKAYMAEDEVLQLHVRSSVGIKKGLMLKNVTGIVDSDYYSNTGNDGNIGLALRNTTDEAVVIEKGERLVQGIFMKYLTVDNDTFLKNERTGGIGSSGK